MAAIHQTPTDRRQMFVHLVALRLVVEADNRAAMIRHPVSTTDLNKDNQEDRRVAVQYRHIHLPAHRRIIDLQLAVHLMAVFRAKMERELQFPRSVDPAHLTQQLPMFITQSAMYLSCRLAYAWFDVIHFDLIKPV